MDEIRVVAQRAKGSFKSSNSVLLEASATFAANLTYDVFLSHSYEDADAILGMKVILESMAYQVYVDWIEDSDLDRESVTKDTAALLRQRMRRCRSLFFVTSDTSCDSRWVPWE